MPDQQIHGAIIEIMRAVEPIAKSLKSSEGYNYRGVEQVYNAVHPLFAEHGVFSTSTILEASQHTITERDKGRGAKQTVVHAILHMRFTFWAKDGSHVATEVVGEGINYGGDKATNKAMSVADKYAILQLLKIPTMMVDPESDPEVPPPENHHQLPPRGEEPEGAAIKAVVDLWKQWRERRGEPNDFEAWQWYVEMQTGRTFDVKKPNQWTKAELALVSESMDE